MIDIEPPELSICQRHSAKFSVLYRSWSTPLSPVRNVITGCCALGCGVMAGAGQRPGAAGGVCWCLPHVSCQRKGCSRSPHRDRASPVTCGLNRRVRLQEMVPVPL